MIEPIQKISWLSRQTGLVLYRPPPPLTRLQGAAVGGPAYDHLRDSAHTVYIDLREASAYNQEGSLTYLRPAGIFLDVYC